MSMTNHKKEIAKFFCGAEAFHAFAHSYFWFSGTSLKVFGITQTPALNVAGAALNALIAIFLGIYTWRTPAPK